MIVYYSDEFIELIKFIILIIPSTNDFIPEVIFHGFNLYFSTF